MDFDMTERKEAPLKGSPTKKRKAEGMDLDEAKTFTGSFRDPAASHGDAEDPFSGPSRRVRQRRVGFSEPVDEIVSGPAPIEDSFMDLIQHMSSIELDKDGSRPEDCPVCQAKFPQSDLAEHVLECIKKLEPEEKKALEQISDRKAREMAQSEVIAAAAAGRSVDQAAALQQFERSRNPICSAGSGCTRTDAQHFMQLFHPPCECPLCGEEYAVYEINAHINLCLNHTDRPDKKAKAAAAARASDDGDADMSGSSSSSSGKGLARSRSAGDLKEAASAGAGAGGDTSMDLERRNAMGGKQLSRVALAAMSKLVLKQKKRNEERKKLLATLPEGKFVSAGSAAVAALDDDDTSLTDLLSTFKSLGFTREALAEAVRSDKEEAEKAQHKAQELSTMSAGSDAALRAASFSVDTAALFSPIGAGGGAAAGHTPAVGPRPLNSPTFKSAGSSRV